MKRLFLIITIVAFVSFDNNCSQPSKGTNLPANSDIRSASPSASPGTSVAPADARASIKAQEELEVAGDQIKHLSDELKIPNLKDTTIDADTEIRVLVSFGLVRPKGFILKETEGRREAFFVRQKATRRGDGTYEVHATKRALDAPRSGWEEFAAFLKREGFEYPLKFRFDEQHVGDPDEGAIVIETKTHGVYDMMFYGRFTTHEDGQKVLQACRKIEQEFDIVLGCNEQQ